MIFNKNSRGRLTLYILFTLSILALVILFLIAKVIPEDVFLLSLTFILICIMFAGGLIIQIRNGPPW